MKKITCSLLILMAFSIQGISQEKKKFKMPELKLREKIGGLAGNLMTGKTEDLSLTSPTISLITGLYSPDAGTSEAKYFPEGSVEGSHIMSITFMKNDGMGMLKVEGEVKCDEDEMEYVGLGSYAKVFDEPLSSDKTINVTTVTGDKASFTLTPVPGIEIISINGETILPIIDLKEDFKIKVSHPAGSEGTTIRVGLISGVAGAVALNNFAEFKATDKEITIPKESFSNMEYTGQLGTGQFEKGLSYLIVTREKITENSEIKAENKTGNAQKATFKSIAYGPMQVVVKGKQEDGIITEVKFSGKYKDKLGFSIYKPNATTGIPFSRASKFGLASLSVSGRTYKKETTSGSSTSYSLGTTSTTTWTRTTTYQFPQLPESYWENAMEAFYKKFNAMITKNFSVTNENVDVVTANKNYSAFFAGNNVINEKGVSKSYRNTIYTTPTSFGEMWANRSSSQSSETTSVLLMKDLNLDGLVSISITFDVGANKDDKLVLLPRVNFSIKGMDETRNFKEGTYAEGFISFNEGVPYNEEKIKSDPNYLVQILNVDELIANIDYMLQALQRKEQELGFDKIWSIGE
jgi:hypothetical protein